MSAATLGGSNTSHPTACPSICFAEQKVLGCLQEGMAGAVILIPQCHWGCCSYRRKGKKGTKSRGSSLDRALPRGKVMELLVGTAMGPSCSFPLLPHVQAKSCLQKAPSVFSAPAISDSGPANTAQELPSHSLLFGVQKDFGYLTYTSEVALATCRPSTMNLGRSSPIKSTGHEGFKQRLIQLGFAPSLVLFIA